MTPSPEPLLSFFWNCEKCLGTKCKNEGLSKSNGAICTGTYLHNGDGGCVVVGRSRSKLGGVRWNWGEYLLR